jgi:hypothetical protein
MSDTPTDRPPGSTPPGPPGAADYGAYARARPRRNGMGTAALVLGVVALVLVLLILFSPLGVLLGLLAVIFGILGIVRVNRGEADNRGQAVAGLVTGVEDLAEGLGDLGAVGVSERLDTTGSFPDFEGIGVNFDGH